MPIEQPYYTAIYNILRSRLSDEDKVNKVACWVLDNPDINRSKFASSFKRAERKDLLDLFIEDEDIKIGERIKSRSTGREGEVIEIGWDGETVKVKWDQGGVQKVTKDSLFLLRKSMEPKHNGYEKEDFSNIRTQDDPYSKTDKKDINTNSDREVKKQEFLI